jgi:protein-tyrosine-phosphatase
MSDRVKNVLFLCTHNSARSVLAECIMNRLGSGKFRGFSAGSEPSGRINPYALALLQRQNHDISALRSKSWDEFEKSDAPIMDFIFTVCDSAAAESCPVWPGQPMTAHWGLPDPSAVKGAEAEIAAAFADTYRMLTQRISILVNLPIASLDQLALKKKLAEIGQSSATPEEKARH